MTGSGKTAAFVLPVLQRLLRADRRKDDRKGGQRRNQGTRALVLVPTRELAIQVDEQVQALGRHTGLRSATVFGGVKPERQIRALRGGVDVVIATPGRLLDLMGQGCCRFDRLEALVLDEADRMLDMGFLPDVRRILAELPTRRQTMLFSATLPRPIVQLVDQLMQKPVRLDVERPSAPAEGIEQAVLPVHERLKTKLLIEMFEREALGTTLIFTRTKHRANKVARLLERAGIPTDRIHGNRSQPQRQKALAAFKKGQIRALVATDIAARGIDIIELPHVVNYDVPGQPEDYIHRVGRTARAKATGEALTFVAPGEQRDLRDIERALGRRLERRQLDGFDYDAIPEAPPAQAQRPRQHRPARPAAKQGGGGKKRAGGSRPGGASHPGRRSDSRPPSRGSRPGSGSSSGSGQRRRRVRAS